MLKTTRGGAITALTIAVAAATSAHAGAVTFTASEGVRSASATFETSGSRLIVTLCNTSTANAHMPDEMLSSVFFDIAGAPLTLARHSAMLGPTDTVVNALTQPVGGDVGGEWAYKNGLVGAPRGAKYGLSSSTLGLFGPSHLFPGENLDGAISPSTLSYAITTAADLGTDNYSAAVVPLVRCAVVLTLDGLPAGFDPAASIGNVSFQYGISLTQPNLPGAIPTPGAAALMGLGTLAIARRRRR